MLIFSLLLLTACSTDNPDKTPEYIGGEGDIFGEDDLSDSYDPNQSYTVTLCGTSATTDATGVTSLNGSVYFTRGGTYLISGELSAGSLIIECPKSEDIRLVLLGVDIYSPASAAIYIKECDTAYITLGDNTNNTIGAGESFASDENGVDGALFSMCDLTLNGGGSLAVTSPVGHGIVAKDELLISGGKYTVTSASHAINANDLIGITSATLTLDAGKDGIHAEHSTNTEFGYIYIANGRFNIEAEGDGISAGAFLQIDSGSFNILTGGGYENGEEHTSSGFGGFGGFGGGPMRPGLQGSSSTSGATDEDSTSIKGLKAKTGLLISDGEFNINSADDTLHSNSDITLSGGKLTLLSGDDGVHADNTLTVSGGEITVSESYEGLEAINVKILGGRISIKATDDGLNAAGGTDSSGLGGARPGESFGASTGSKGTILISGGELSITASGDGIDSNGTLNISGGYTTVTGPTIGDTAVLDFDTTASITGGVFIGTGAYNMAQVFTSSTQGVFAVRAGSVTAGTTLTLTDSGGNEIISYTPTLNYQLIIISTPDMTSGEEYTITVGDATGTFEAS